MSLLSFQEDRINLIEEIFDLFDSENLGYVEIKDSLKILTSIGKKLDIEDENDFLSLVDPKNEGRVSKENFIRGVEEMFTLPKDFLEEVEDALKFFDRNDKGKVSGRDEPVFPKPGYSFPLPSLMLKTYRKDGALEPVAI